MLKLPLLLMVFIGLSPVVAAGQQNNDFPTVARVEFVIGCMKARGDENYDNLYACSCAIDYISTQFTFDEFSEAEVYRQLRQSPGERGGVFRDPPQAETLRDKLQAVNETAEKRCFYKTVVAQ